MAEAKAAPKAKKEEGKVKVYALRPPFIDLITNTEIGETPIEVEMHPWLEAQVAAGHLAIA